MFREDTQWAPRAARIAAMTRDITEIVYELGYEASSQIPQLSVAYHSACSMQHGQKVTEVPPRLLKSAGFTVKSVPEGHICCGSAGTYHLLQPDIAVRLRDRKVANIERTGADLVATGNFGCISQIGQAAQLPVVHTVELLDWASGGPRPSALGRG